MLCSAGLQAAFYLQRYVAQVDALESEAKERVGCFAACSFCGHHTLSPNTSMPAYDMTCDEHNMSVCEANMKIFLLDLCLCTRNSLIWLLEQGG